MSEKPRRRFRFLRDVAVSLGVAVVLWVGCEVVLRVAAPQVSRTEWVDGWSRALQDSVLGHRYRPGAKAIHRTPEFSAEYTIDASGHRAGTRAGDPSGVRVLVLGDSFTFGDGVAPEEVWTTVMSRALSERGLAADVINAGVEGYDTRSEAHYLFELEPTVKPDVVVLAFLANDVYSNEPLDAAAPRSIDEHRETGRASHVIALAKRIALQSDRILERLFVVTSRREYYTVPPTAHVAKQLETTRALLAAIDEFCRARGVGFVVVSIPQQFGVVTASRGDRVRGIDPRAIDRDLEAFASARGFLWIDMLDPLARSYRSTGVDMFYRVDGHLTPDGHRIVGESAAEAIAPLLATRAR